MLRRSNPTNPISGPISGPASATPPAAKKRRTTWHSLLAAVAIGVVLGTLLSIGIVFFGPQPEAFSRVKVLTFDPENGPGTPYALEITLARDGYPIVVHVDEEGWPSLLFPISVPSWLPKGQKAILPDPDGGATWWVEGSTDGSSLLVTVADRPSLSASRLTSLLERAAVATEDPEDARDRMADVLRRRVGPTIVQPLHIPDSTIN